MNAITFTRDAPTPPIPPSEEVWLPIIGPTAWLLAKLVVEELIVGERTTWEVWALARRLGVGRSETSTGPIPKAIARLEYFGLVAWESQDAVTVRSAWGTPRPRRERAAHR